MIASTLSDAQPQGTQEAQEMRPRSSESRNGGKPARLTRAGAAGKKEKGKRWSRTGPLVPLSSRSSTVLSTRGAGINTPALRSQWNHALVIVLNRDGASRLGALPP
uniref:Uncharacterized protein n=1 Tax=Arundo donax TaxID=35708 RepID=A0A0A9H1B2_ARUDO